jgi:glutamate-5-semialdehyde dehydrogenase
MLLMGREARSAAAALRLCAAEQRTRAIEAMARQIRLHGPRILEANALDVAAATGMVDRLRLDEARLEAMAAGVEAVAGLPDPSGEEMARWTRPNGLDIARVRTPIGVIGMIYESRPNVTADAAAICLRSANAIILRSGSEALRSALAIHAALGQGLADAGLPPACVQIVRTADRDAVGMMLDGLGGAVDLIIPRGGKALVERVSREARVPVLGHLEGVCHTYVHASADPDMAARWCATPSCGGCRSAARPRRCSSTAKPHRGSCRCSPRRWPGCELRGDPESRAVLRWRRRAKRTGRPNIWRRSLP